MNEELDIRSLSVTVAAKLLKVTPTTIRTHIRRGLPLVGGRSAVSRSRSNRIDLIVCAAWLNQQEERKKNTDSGGSPQDAA